MSLLMHPVVVFGGLIGGTIGLAGFIVWWLTPPQSEFPEAETHERTLAALGALPPAFFDQSVRPVPRRYRPAGGWRDAAHTAAASRPQSRPGRTP